MKLIMKYFNFFALGIVSGMPLSLTGSTLSMRLIDLGVEKSTISAIGILAVIYAVKFLYAPILDWIKIPILHKIVGRRRDWLFIALFIEAITMYFCGFVESNNDILLICITVFLIGFFSTIFDISVDAYRIETNEKAEQGIISAVFVYGYRVGMILTGGGCLYLAQFFGWSTTYLITGVIYVMIGFLAIFFAKRVSKEIDDESSKRKGFKQIFLDPFLDILSRPYSRLFLLMIATFKLTDVYVGSMTNPFLTELGFSKVEIANIVKGVGLVATLLGAGFGGYLTKKLTISHSIFVSLILQICANQFFILQNYAGHNNLILCLVICIENFCSSIGTVTLVSIISRSCNVTYSGTQYAVFSAFAAFARTVIGGGSGYLATHLGWNLFFLAAGLIEIPSMLLAMFLLRKKVIS